VYDLEGVIFPGARTRIQYSARIIKRKVVHTPAVVVGVTKDDRGGRGEMLIGVRGAAEIYVNELNFDVVCDGVVGDLCYLPS